MKLLFSTLFILILLFVLGFRAKDPVKLSTENEGLTINLVEKKDSTILNKNVAPLPDKNEQNIAFVEYAKKLMGVPYLYGSTNPAKGLDCSGFINAVSNHFGIKVPRSSVEFTDLGATVQAADSAPGDLILFTGTDPNTNRVGHIGIITENRNGDLQFIHSSSGKAKGVTISELKGYYETRFVKVVRIFPVQEDKIVV